MVGGAVVVAAKVGAGVNGRVVDVIGLSDFTVVVVCATVVVVVVSSTVVVEALTVVKVESSVATVSRAFSLSGALTLSSLQPIMAKPASTPITISFKFADLFFMFVASIQNKSFWMLPNFT